MINEIQDNETILSFYNLIPYFETFFGCDLGFTITNTEKYLFAQYNDSFKKESKNLSTMPKTGEPFPPNSAADVCIKQQRVVNVNVPESVFGIPVKTTAVPVWVDGKVEGVIVIAMSKKKQREVLGLSRTIFDELSKMTDNTSEMTARFEEINATNLGIEKFINETTERARKTDEILSFVNSITHKTNLLGLNASIEAARAGEAGKGFSVVAQEISKLSQSTKQSVDEINKVLREIKDNIEQVGIKLNSSNELLESQIGELTSIAQCVQSLNNSADQLKNFAEQL